jgi:hypothetical protein
VKHVPLLAILLAVTAFAHETLTTTVLFDREIVRVLNNHCVMCHSANGPSFPLETYEQTYLQGRKIRADVIARHMPPWPAVPGYGSFANDNTVTLRESQFMVSWVEGLGPRNSGTVFLNVLDGGTKPKVVKAEPDFNHWKLGQPNLIKELPPNVIEAQQPDDIKRTVVDLGLTSERRVRAIEYMPGDRRVVRAAVFSIQETGQWLGSWTPWYGFMKLPERTAYRLPAGSHLVTEIYYRGSMERVAEHGSLGFFFTDTPEPKIISDLAIESKGDVPPGTGNQKFRTETKLPADTYAVALRPEVARGIKSIEVAVRKPDGVTDVLLFAKDIPLDWPTPYIFTRPVLIRAASTLAVTAYFENSSNAPQPGGFRLTVSRYLSK